MKLRSGRVLNECGVAIITCKHELCPALVEKIIAQSTENKPPQCPVCETKISLDNILYLKNLHHSGECHMKREDKPFFCESGFRHWNF